MSNLKKLELSKLYYSIGEVATIFDVNASLLRFWEKEFKILKPKKNKKGNRMFTQKDVNNIQLIFYLVKERGYTLDGAKAKLKDNVDDIIENQEIVNRLKIVKEFLIEIKANL
jgi:DNA-binding transcriptional MerR regulator